MKVATTSNISGLKWLWQENLKYLVKFRGCWELEAAKRPNAHLLKNYVNYSESCLKSGQTINYECVVDMPINLVVSLILNI